MIPSVMTLSFSDFLDFFSLVDVASFFLEIFFDSALAIGFSGSGASVEEHDDEFETTDDLPDQLEMVKSPQEPSPTPQEMGEVWLWTRVSARCCSWGISLYRLAVFGGRLGVF
jgi:hypothetical protein